jgi:MYXO-CTERM domain-containing protein
VLYNLPFDSNFSQGLYVGDDRGYHAALDGGTTTSPNYSFALDGSDYTFESQFATHGPTGFPEVEVGDLTPVPTPGALALLVLAGLAARRRRR